MITLEQKKNLKEEINQTVEIISGKNAEKKVDKMATHVFNPYDFLYSFATEDIRGYSKEFDQPKTFLTVGGSGDQLFNAILLGADRIDVFDYNKLVKRFIALKIAAAKVFDSETFYRYFQTFDIELFGKLISELSEEDRIYWESLYDYLDYSVIRSNFFYRTLPKETTFQINSYLDNEKYDQFQSRLSQVEINYFDSDLYSLPSKIKGRYDAINFSNIYEYLNYGVHTSLENASRYYQFITEQMYPLLNSNGAMMFAYLYAFSDTVKKYFDEMYDKSRKLLSSSIMTSFEEMEMYQNGLTSQNYSYSLLLDMFQHENIKKVLTNHIVYGQSLDKSHDMALILKK